MIMTDVPMSALSAITQIGAWLQLLPFKKSQLFSEPLTLPNYLLGEFSLKTAVRKTIWIISN
jgi:hypothetical protein